MLSNKTLLEVLLSIGIVLLGGTFTAADAQEATTAGDTGKNKPTLVIGSVTGQRGATATIPLYYRTVPKIALRSVHLEFDFVSSSVKFVKADKGIAAETQDYELSVKSSQLAPERDDNKLEHTRISIDVAVANSEGGKVLPEGLLAYLNFQVPSDSKPAAISLKPVSASARNISKQPVDIGTESGLIMIAVEDEPGVVCFFFSH